MAKLRGPAPTNLLGPEPWRRISISADVIPHRHQRYNDVGDWHVKTRLNPSGIDFIKVTVSDTGHPLLNARLLIHEVAEALLCYCNRVSTAAVDDWDITQGKNGDQPGAPYKLQHGFASSVERMFAELDGGPAWEDYENVIEHLIAVRAANEEVERGEH